MINDDLFNEGRDAFDTKTPRANPYNNQESGGTAPQSWLLGYIEALTLEVRSLKSAMTTLEDVAASDKAALESWKTDLAIKLAPQKKAAPAPKPKPARVGDDT
jgi:hypothetical protein